MSSFLFRVKVDFVGARLLLLCGRGCSGGFGFVARLFWSRLDLVVPNR